MLIKTIQMETHDDMLFSRYGRGPRGTRRRRRAFGALTRAEVMARLACTGPYRAHPLLPAASELAFHTVDVSALNAEGAWTTPPRPRPCRVGSRRLCSHAACAAPAGNVGRPRSVQSCAAKTAWRSSAKRSRAASTSSAARLPKPLPRPRCACSLCGSWPRPPPSTAAASASSRSPGWSPTCPAASTSRCAPLLPAPPTPAPGPCRLTLRVPTRRRSTGGAARVPRG